jgi:alpha-tubulin suppressor-like RCC1 family protein
VPRMQDKSAAAISCGNAHTVALTDNGNVWSWVSFVEDNGVRDVVCELPVTVCSRML